MKKDRQTDRHTDRDIYRFASVCIENWCLSSMPDGTLRADAPRVRMSSLMMSRRSNAPGLNSPWAVHLGHRALGGEGFFQPMINQPTAFVIQSCKCLKCSSHFFWEYVLFLLPFLFFFFQTTNDPAPRGRPPAELN